MVHEHRHVVRHPLDVLHEHLSLEEGLQYVQAADQDRRLLVVLAVLLFPGVNETDIIQIQYHIFISQ